MANASTDDVCDDGADSKSPRSVVGTASDIVPFIVAFVEDEEEAVAGADCRGSAGFEASTGDVDKDDTTS